MKVLAVDDDPLILELLRQFMSAIGDHDLTTAPSGPDALAILEKSVATDFDCFIFDIQMPGMDGVELIGKAREFRPFMDTPILMLTAMSEKRYIDAAFTAGATDYVTKPFEVAELRSRLELVEGLIKRGKITSRKVFAATGVGEEDGAEQQIGLFDPISIYDVDNVIDHTALENYVAQLTRSSLFGSTVFAISIRKINEFHHKLSGFEYCSMISDVAEVISDVLLNHQFLMSYAGNGVFVCIADGGWRPDMEKLRDYVNLSLSRTEIFNNSGEQLEPRVVTGDAIRLVWKTGRSLMESLAEAHISAEEASIAYENEQRNLWRSPKKAEA